MVEGDKLRVVAHRGEDIREVTRSISINQGITGWVAKHGEPMLIPDVEKDDRYLRFLENTRSEVAVPIFKGNTVIGVLNIEHSQAGVFTKDHLNLAQSMAGLASVAMKLDRKVHNLNALYEMGQRLTAGLQLSEPEIIELIDEQASQLMDTRNMYIALYDARTDTVRFPMMRVNGEYQPVPPRSSGHGRTEWIIHTKEPLLIRTEVESKAWYAQPGHKEYIGESFASWIGVPMVAGEEVIGVIAAYHEEQEYLYDEDDLEILQLMANQAAIALKSARQLELMQSLAVDLSTGLLDA
jgi:GAF domain-containing protein